MRSVIGEEEMAPVSAEFVAEKTDSITKNIFISTNPRDVVE